MKMFLISDNTDTLTGMRLAGIEGVIARGREELLEALGQVFTNKEIGILLLTEHFYHAYPDIIREAESGRKLPLLVEIPDRHGSRRKSNSITSRINEAIGSKL